MKLTDIQKKVNKDDTVLVKLGDAPERSIDRISTGILAVDAILGGGFPAGQMVELYGNHGSGKSSIAMRYAGQAQSKGKVVWIDLENAFDPHMADNSGVNIPDLWIATPETAEDTLMLMEEVQKADDVSAVVLDSAAGLVPRAELEGDVGDAHVGLTARLLSQSLRRMGAIVRSNRTGVTIVWINQIREKIGTMGYGPTTDSTGGRALKFWCATRLEVARTGQVKQGEDVIGHTVKVKSQKSKFAPPFQHCSFDILYDTGISNESTLMDLAIAAGLIEKSGGWYTILLTGEKVQGKPAVLNALRSDPQVYEDLMSKLEF